MKKLEQAKTSECEYGVDKISNLPDHILHLIISRIPTTEEVIRTNILSKRWRYLWTLVPFIDIDYIRGWDESDGNGFKEFVYWVLLNKPQDLDSIRLWCANYQNMSTIRQWIDAAVVRKVKLLDLMFSSIDESETIELPQCLVTCDTLEVLKLFLMGSTLTLPKLTGFVALRVLELTNVELDQGDLVKYFLESCPLLEDLSLIDCNACSLDISSPKLKNLIIDSQEKITYKEYINRQKVTNGEDINDDSSIDTDTHWQMCLSLEISCPKLVFLKLNGYVALECLFDRLYSLKKAVIYAQELFEGVETVYDLFDELSHVESLSISLYCVQQMTYMIEDPICLPNLKTLELTVDALHALIPFLTCLPDLEYLHLIFPKYVYGLDKWNLEEGETISILTCHLKKVEFLECDEEKPTLAVARALLEHGNELEEMVFRWNNEAKFHEGSLETMNEVSKFHKASSTVKLRYVIKPHVVYSRPD